MKLVIGSDIHGAALWCKKFLEVVDQEQPDRIVLLGDILYHGPRNDVPEDYDPKAVIAMLNPLADRIIAVRGNCEAEVDQMVLDFPCLAEYNILWDPEAQNRVSTASGVELFLTHGHLWGAGIHNSVDHMPKLSPGACFVYGHTHKKVNTTLESYPTYHFFNPGSIGLPKDGTHSIGIYHNGIFTYREL